MRNLWLAGIVILSVLSCRQNQNQDQVSDDSELEFVADELPPRQSVNAKAAKELSGWVEYQAFDQSFDGIYSALNNEDLILVMDDLIEKQDMWEDSTYPEIYDVAQIKSRQKILKTYILKVKSTLDYRADFMKEIINMIEAYNALRGQFDVIVNSNLDPKLLIDEE